jgi:hypothetical protein
MDITVTTTIVMTGSHCRAIGTHEGKLVEQQVNLYGRLSGFDRRPVGMAQIL